jgi:hypothetical protein
MEPFTKALLDRAKSLVGGVLRGVHCNDELSEPVEPSRQASGAGFAIHHSVDLVLDREVVHVFSSSEFTDGTFELALRGGQLPEGSDEVDAASANATLPWSELTGQPIVSSRIHWVDSPYVALTKRRKVFSSHHYDAGGAVPFSGPQAPLALELHFANGGRVLLVSGSWIGVSHAIVGTGAGIAVLWDATAFATLVPSIARELKKSW